MLTEDVEKQLETHETKHVIIAGVEAHVCVQQTALDLLRRGYSVHVAADAVSAQDQQDVDLMRNRLTAAGANVSSSLSILYEVMGDAKHPSFKEVLSHVKKHAEDTANAADKKRASL